MRIITVNVNGIRSAAKKGFYAWLGGQGADVVCLQEIRAQEHQLPPEALAPAGLKAWFYPALRPGYGGVALYARREPDRVVRGLGWPEADEEGRWLQADFGRLSMVSLYVPSGSASEERQAAKFAFLDRFLPALRARRRQRREWVICGDWNIAHKEIDLKNWRSNQKNSGFLPEERAWMDEVFGAAGFVDAFRVVDPRPDQYTWWSNRGQAWAKNVGWRIDYQVVTPGLRGEVRAASIYRDERFSDHAPLVMDYALTLQ